MSNTLDIPKALAGELSVEAQRRELSLSDYLVTLLADSRNNFPKPVRTL